MTGHFYFYTGPMFSGKTEELLRIRNLYVIADKNVLTFTPKKDTRGGTGFLLSHANKAVKATPITHVADVYPEIENYPGNIDAIFIDEIQFISLGDVLQQAAAPKFVYGILERGINLYVSGLILDCFRNAFSTSRFLLPYANKIELFKAVCDNCGNFSGEFTYRTIEDKAQEVVGGKDIYKALCKDCYKKEGENEI